MWRGEEEESSRGGGGGGGGGEETVREWLDVHQFIRSAEKTPHCRVKYIR
jgi:hypothetical protein